MCVHDYVFFVTVRISKHQSHQCMFWPGGGQTRGNEIETCLGGEFDSTRRFCSALIAETAKIDKQTYTCGWMDGWMDEWMDRQTERQI